MRADQAIHVVRRRGVLAVALLAFAANTRAVEAAGSDACRGNRFRLAGSLSFIGDMAFFGDVMTRSLGLVGKIVRVDCR